MTELTLTFTRPPRAELIETQFEHPSLGGKLVARLGAYDRSFKWTAGVQALSALLLRTAAWHRGIALRGEMPSLEGHRPGPAASLNDVLTSKPQWASDVFGRVAGRPLLGHLIKRWNADFNTSPKAPVRLWIETAELPPASIRVCVGGRVTYERDELLALAEDIGWQWGGGAKGVGQQVTRAHTPAESPGVRLDISENRVLIDIVLDRPFESFGPEDEDELLRAIRALLRTGRELPVRGKRPGSVILTLELTEGEARELAAAVAGGALAEFRATAVRTVTRCQQEPWAEGSEATTEAGNGIRPTSMGPYPFVSVLGRWRLWLAAPRRIALAGALFGAVGGLWLATPAKRSHLPHVATEAVEEARGHRFICEPACAIEAPEPAQATPPEPLPDASRERFLRYLASLRHRNEQDDTVDSPGYALNLVRLPVRILPDRIPVHPSCAPARRVRARTERLSPPFTADWTLRSPFGVRRSDRSVERWGGVLTPLP